jgi:hypothetical protein
MFGEKQQNPHGKANDQKAECNESIDRSVSGWSDRKQTEGKRVLGKAALISQPNGANDMKTLWAGLVMAALTTAANAAEIKVDSMMVGRTRVPIVAVIGKIEWGDHERFRQVISKMPVGRTMVVLDSPGGSAPAAINMGLDIRAKKFATVALDLYTSACALIWLAGGPRAVFENSSVGFHSVYDLTNDNKAVVSAGGNAWVGVYLSKLGFGWNTIDYLTDSAAPDSMEYLNEAKAKKYGIALRVIPAKTRKGEEAARQQQQQQAPKTSAADDDDPNGMKKWCKLTGYKAAACQQYKS